MSFRSRHRHLPHGMRLSGPFPAQPFRDPADKRLSDVTFGDGKHSLIRNERHILSLQHKQVNMSAPAPNSMLLQPRSLLMLMRRAASAMQPNNMAADLKPQGEEATPKVKVGLSCVPTPFDWDSTTVADKTVSALLRMQRREIRPRRVYALLQRRRSAGGL